MDIFCKSFGPTISFTQLLQVFEAVNKRAAKNSIWTKPQKSHLLIKSFNRIASKNNGLVKDTKNIEKLHFSVYEQF
jgi:hypothetical protein